LDKIIDTKVLSTCEAENNFVSIRVYANKKLMDIILWWNDARLVVALSNENVNNDGADDCEKNIWL